MKSAAALTFSLLLTACGGKVVIDSGSPLEPGEPLVSTCEEVCTSGIPACGGTPSGCADGCAQSEKMFTKQCTAEWQAFLLCVSENPGAQCQKTHACDGELQDLTSCVLDTCAIEPQACNP